MDNKAVTELSRSQRKKNVTVNKKTLIYVIFQISILSIILLFPVFYKSLLAYTSTLLALCTLFSFGGIIVYLSIRLLVLVSDCMGSGKHAKVDDEIPPIKKTFVQRSFGLLTIMGWTFVLNLFQPFVATLVWWQGYKLMEGRAFSLGEVEGTAMLVESLVYFIFVIFLILLSRPYWLSARLKNAKSVLSYEENVIVTKGKAILNSRRHS